MGCDQDDYTRFLINPLSGPLEDINAVRLWIRRSCSRMYLEQRRPCGKTLAIVSTQMTLASQSLGKHLGDQ